MASKKTFADKIKEKAVNPTLQFISPPEPEDDQIAEEAATIEPQPKELIPSTTRRALPQYEETKSRRLQLLLTPSLFEAVKAKASEERLSVNEYINSILKNAVRK